MTDNSLDPVDLLRRRVLGTVFPPGTLRVEDYEDWLARDAIGSVPARDDTAHPAWLLLGALRSTGLTLDDIVRACDGSWDVGVMFGETSIDVDEPLRRDVDYRVDARFTDLQARHGRTIGRFDVVTYVVSFLEGDRVAARCTNTFVVRRAVAA